MYVWHQSCALEGPWTAPLLPVFSVCCSLRSQVSLKLLDLLVECLAGPPQLGLFSQKSKRISFVSLHLKSWLLLTTNNTTLYWYFDLKPSPPHCFWLTLLTVNPDVNNHFFFSFSYLVQMDVCHLWREGGKMYRWKLFSVMYCKWIFL